MKSIRNSCVVAGCIAMGGGVGGQVVEVEPVRVVEGQRVVELAICLDTSGSMSGLINAAKQKLWAIVNELALAEPTPTLRVALLTYGNNGHDPENGWVRVDSGLTDDLDLISQKLFALTTNGGTEYVGRVLSLAGQLDWNPSNEALKLIVVAGNEAADQDQQVPYPGVCRTLIGRGIMINSIYCGPAGDSIAAGWQQVARLADGQFACIDQDRGTIVMESPFDEQLAALSASVNETYVPFGTRGEEGLLNQAAQDANAQSLNGAAAAQRAQTKGQALYFCSWDLIDACASGQVKVDQIAEEDLPQNMREMSGAERTAYVEQMAQRRAEIKRQIDDVGKQRDAYVQAEMQRQALDGSQSLDDAIRRAVRDQARKKGLDFPEAAEPVRADESTE